MKKTKILISVLLICISLTACQFIDEIVDGNLEDESWDFELYNSKDEKEEDTNSYETKSIDSIINRVTENKSYHDENFDSDEYIQEALNLINEARLNEDLPVFETSINISEAASKRALEISQEGSFSNIRPNNENWSTIYDEFGVNYTKASENIASGYLSPEDLINNLISSENAKESVYSMSFNKLGIGVHKVDGIVFWELLFVNDESFKPIPKEEYAKEVLRLTNIERYNAGLSIFITDSEITNAADKRSEETIEIFDHIRPDGRTIYTVFEEYGVSEYKTAGENIASGQMTPEEVVNGWMNSRPARENILNRDFNKMGVGIYHYQGSIYWTQLFTD